MTKTAKLIAPALVASLMLGAAAPASARGYEGHGHNVGNAGQAGFGLQRAITKLDRDIDRAENRRLISGREARQLDWQVDQLQRQYRQFTYGGLNRREIGTLTVRIDALERKLAAEIRDRDRRANTRYRR